MGIDAVEKNIKIAQLHAEIKEYEIISIFGILSRKRGLL